MKNSPVRKLHLISNAKSGRGHGGSTLKEIAQKICSEHSVELLSYEIANSKEFSSKTDKAIAACKADGGVVAAAGGDGTIRGVAQKIHATNLPFAVIPCGTYNFFARTHKIPEDQEAALRLALTESPRPVRLGQINGEVFLINASMGLYARAIQERESRTSRFGRHRIVASISTILTFLDQHRLLDLTLSNGKEITRRFTPMVFIGNNALQLRNLSMDVASCMKLDLLAVVLMKPLTQKGVLKLIFRGITRSMEKAEGLENFCVESLDIHTRRPHHTVALDGELFQMTTPFKVRSLPESLLLVLPPKEGTP